MLINQPTEINDKTRYVLYKVQPCNTEPGGGSDDEPGAIAMGVYRKIAKKSTNIKGRVLLLLARVSSCIQWSKKETKKGNVKAADDFSVGKRQRKK